MKHSVRRLPLAALLGAALVATGCAGSSLEAEKSSGDYKVLGVIAKSGPHQAYGTLTENALKVQADYINANGGINGRKVVLEWVDDQGDATKAVSLLQDKLSGSSRPDAVLAGSTSNETLAMLPILSREKIINIGSTGADPINDPEKFPYTFRANSPFASAANAVATQFKELGYEKVGILQGDDALGQSNSASYEKAMKDAGIETTTATFNPTGLDMSAPISQLKADKVDAIVFSATAGSTAAQILQARAKAGMTDVPIFADTSTTADLATLVSPEALKNAFATSYNVALSNPKGGVQPRVTQFIKDMKKLGPITSTLITPALNADGLKLLEVAAKQAGSTDPDKLKDALENLDEQPPGTWLVFGQVKFTKESHFNLGSQPSDYGYTTLGPIVDGQVTPQR